MKSAILGIAIAVASFGALAGETYRFDRGVVTVGDSLATLVQKAGRQPDRIVILENSRGAAVGERWEYYLRDKQVNFETRGGKIVEITEIR